MLIIDRFEGNWAVLEMDGQIFQVPRQLLPPEAAEGACLRAEFTLDAKAQAARENKMQQLWDQLF